MLLNSVIFVLHEVLEASLIISVLLALSQNQVMSKKWALPAVLVGLILAGFYANQLATISSYFNGVGQELVNAGLHFLVYVFILLTIVLLKYPWTKSLAILAMSNYIIFTSIKKTSGGKRLRAIR